MAVTKSQLAIILSRLDTFEKPDARLEQYPTDSEIAADICWNAFMLGDIKDKRIFDLGCGTGILGIAAALLGAKSIKGIDLDREAVTLAEKNLQKVRDLGVGITNEITFSVSDIAGFRGKGDTAIQNPPFGTRGEHADRLFLEKAFEACKVVYSLHKSSTRGFIASFAAKKGFKVTHEWDYPFPIKRMLPEHRRDIHRIRATAFRLVKEGPASDGKK